MDDKLILNTFKTDNNNVKIFAEIKKMYLSINLATHTTKGKDTVGKVCEPHHYHRYNIGKCGNCVSITRSLPPLSSSKANQAHYVDVVI